MAKKKVQKKILSSPGLDESSSEPSREDRAHNAAKVLNSIIDLWINTPDKDLDFSDDNFSDIWTALGSRRVLPHDIECIVTSLYTFGWRNSDWKGLQQFLDTIKLEEKNLDLLSRIFDCFNSFEPSTYSNTTKVSKRQPVDIN